ncbi:MAG TPA: hypothetical protein VF645_12465 [Allosphingosinicella sp.]|jgi:hypothetical protein
MDRKRGPGRRCGLAGTTALVALTLGGCVGKLETTPYRERTPTLGGALRGVSYSLPKLQYEIELTRSLTECPGSVGSDRKPTSLKFGFEVDGTARYVPGEAYTVNYDRLAGLLRTSDFDIKYWPNGTLKSLGAGAEDHSAEVVGDLVKTGLSIASFGGGGATAAAIARATNYMNMTRLDGNARHFALGCTQEAIDLLKAQADLSDDLKVQTEALATYVEQAERILARAAVRLKSDDDRKALIALFDKIDAAEDRIEEDKEKLDEIAEGLSVTDTVLWNSNMDNVADQSVAYPLSAKQRAKLARLLTRIEVAPPAAGDEAELARRALTPECFEANANPEKCVARHLDLKTGIAMASHLPGCDHPDAKKPECIDEARPTFRRDTALRDSINRRYRDARDLKPDSGLFVREPMRAQLLFCRIARDEGTKGCHAANDEGKMDEAYFPQLGQLRYLPLRVGPFQARKMSIALAEDGRIESFTYANTKAAAAGFAAMTADVAGQVYEAREKRETDRRSDLAYAREQEVAGIQGEITRLTKEAELKKLQTPAPEAAPNPLQATLDETIVLNTEIALLKAKLMKLQAAKELSQAQQ